MIQNKITNSIKSYLKNGKLLTARLVNEQFNFVVCHFLEHFHIVDFCLITHGYSTYEVIGKNKLFHYAK